MKTPNVIVWIGGLLLLTTAACDGGVGSVEGLAPLPDNPGFAVVLTDYGSTAIAMLDAEGEVLDGRWVHSGTTAPGLVTTLSGDVTLPTRRAGGDSITLLDRMNADVVTRFEVPSGELIGQVRTHGTLNDTGFSSNPQDVTFLAPDRAWVSRMGVNLDPSAPPENQGNDLLEIDPGTMQRTGGRVDLSELDATATHAGSGETVVAAARPGRMVRVGDVVLVGLSRLSADFQAAGEGMIAVVPVEGGETRGFPLAGLRNCGHVQPVPGAPLRVLVTCTGFAVPFDDEDQRRGSAGFVLLEVDGDEVTEMLRWTAAADAQAAIAVFGATSLGDTRVLATAYGSMGTPGDESDVTPDRLHLLELSTGQQREVHVSTEPFAIGRPALDPERGLLLVPDAATGLHRYHVEGDSLTHVDHRTLDPALGLPARSVRWLGTGAVESSR